MELNETSGQKSQLQLGENLSHIRSKAWAEQVCDKMGETMIVWIGIAWLVCTAIFLELANRAPVFETIPLRQGKP